LEKGRKEIKSVRDEERKKEFSKLERKKEFKNRKKIEN